MDMGISDRVVFVTGASGGIGSAVARAFAGEGAAVAFGWYRNEAAAVAGAEDVVRAGGRAVPVYLDQGDPDSVDAAFATINARLGAVEVLVANALSRPDLGFGGPVVAPEMLAANVTGALSLVGSALPGMRAAGWGRVVVVSSDMAAQPEPDAVGYCAVKGALEATVRVLAVREAQHGVLTNTVRPGFTSTVKGQNRPTVLATETARTPTGRVSAPDDVASLVLYLGSAANSQVNGEVVAVTGGRQLIR